MKTICRDVRFCTFWRPVKDSWLVESKWEWITAVLGRWFKGMSRGWIQDPVQHNATQYNTPTNHSGVITKELSQRPSDTQIEYYNLTNVYSRAVVLDDIAQVFVFMVSRLNKRNKSKILSLVSCSVKDNFKNKSVLQLKLCLYALMTLNNIKHIDFSLIPLFIPCYFFL